MVSNEQYSLKPFLVGSASCLSGAALRGQCALTRAIPAHEAEPARSTNAWYTQLVQLWHVLSPAAAHQQLFLPPADFAFARGSSSALCEAAHWQSGLSQREKPPGQWAGPTKLDG